MASGMAHTFEHLQQRAAELLGDDALPPPRTTLTSAIKTGRVHKVVDGIYVALGYGMSTVTWLEGPEGVVVVDTSESLETGTKILTHMREFVKAPISAIVYTHNHFDHVKGAQAFIEDPENPPDIWAHEHFERELDNFATVGASLSMRKMRQFGLLLPTTITRGVATKVHYGRMTNGFVMPNKFMHGTQVDVNLAGLSLRLLHLPGETEDQMGIWLPERGVLLCADDIYESFPNLYAIRGTPIRNARKWIASLDLMRKLRPRHLVLGHGKPIEGEIQVYDTLTVYRDALQYVHDQTVRYINQGLGPEDIACRVQLPDEIATCSYLVQRYGTVEWSVRSVFDEYMGWFSGDVSQMAAITSQERAQAMVDLAGGKDRLLQVARDKLAEGKAKWALELVSHLLRVDRHDPQTRGVRLAALKAVAREQLSRNGSNYLLTTALEDHDIFNMPMVSSSQEAAAYMTSRQMFIRLQTRLNPELSANARLNVLFHFKDTDELWVTQLRHCVLEVTTEALENYDLKITTTKVIWRKILTGALQATDACENKDIVLEGELDEFKKFCSYFQGI